MQIERHWHIPSAGLVCSEVLDRPEGWGKSLFWYCVQCGSQYAFAKIPERVWQGIGGRCSRCSAKSDKWIIAGTVADANALIGEALPPEILRHQLRMELVFLSHPKHPYNEKE